jgi:osmotically-inducible protein OsmY
MKRIVFTAASLAILSISLSGCGVVGVAAGVGATVGVAAAQEGGLKGATNDVSIRVAITDAWLHENPEIYKHCSLTVREGRVLLTGTVPNPDMRVDAVRLAWQANGVRQVINEITVAKGGGVTSYVTDSWITGQIKTHLTFDKYIQSINYTVETVNGTVYIMGIGQDQRELDRVLDYARNTKHVKNVVSYVRLRGETPPGMLPASDETPGRKDAQKSVQPAPVTQEPPGAAQGPAAAPSDHVEQQPLNDTGSH